jgi:TP901 family phage tail tape measure protein
MAKQITQKLGFQAGGAIRSLGNLNKKLTESTQLLRQMKAASGGVSAPLAQGTKQLARTSKQLDKTSKKTKEMTLSWSTMARVIQTQIAIRSFTSLIQQLTEGIELARELGLAVEEVQTIAGNGLGSSEQITQDILNLSNAIGKAPTDLAEGLYQTLSNQVVDAGEALNFTSEAAKLATVTSAETGDAVNALSSVMNSYGLAASEAEHISGTLFKTIELGRLRLSEIANVIGRVTPLTSRLGISWEETAAAIATMTRQGVRADTAITQLRAVTQKLLKPTEGIKNLYREWGVETGEEAIEAFGGLVGVLQKLSEETGGNSQEMAELFRRVRAIVGTFGILQDDGKLVADTLAEIENATTAATEAWERFSESDAQELTRTMQQFKNEMLALGKTAIPAVIAGLNFMNNLMQKTATTVLVLTGNMDLARKSQNTINEAIAAGERETKKLEKSFAEAARKQEDQWKEARTASAKYYAEIRKEEFQLQDLRDKGIERANSAYESAVDSISSYFGDANKELESAIKRSKDAIVDTANEIADLQKTINERRLDAQLDATQGYYAKQQLLQAKLNDAQKDFTEAFGAIDATPESKARAVEAAKLIDSIAKRASEVAKEAGVTQDVAKFERLRTAALVNQKNALEISRSEMEKAIPAAEEELKRREEITAEVEAAVKQYKDLISSGDLLSDNESIRKRAEAIKDALTDTILKGVADAKNGDALLESFNLEKTFSEFSVGMSDALDRAHKDWAAEVQRMKDEFEDAEVTIRAKIDSQGVTKSSSEALGVSRISGEGDVEFTRRVNKAAEEVQKRNLEIQGQTQRTAQKIKTEYDGLQATIRGNTAQVENIIQAKLKELRVTSTIKDEAVLRAKAEQRAYSIIESGGLNYEDRFKGQRDIRIEFERILNSIKSGVPVMVEELKRLDLALVDAVNQDEITQDAGEGLQSALIRLSHLNAELAKTNKLQKEGPSQEETVAAQLQLDARQKLVDKQKEGVQKQQEAKTATEQTKQAQDSVTSAAGQTKDNLNQGATAAASIGSNAAASVGPLNAASGAAAGLAANLEKAAAAQAKLGAAKTGGSFYAGGAVRHLAAGGFERGQDRTLVAAARGETIINSKSSRRFFSELNAMNQGSQPVYREQGGTVTNVGDVNVTVNGGDTSQQTVREIGHALRRDIKRGIIRLN